MGEMQPTHPEKRYSMYNEAYKGDEFELFDETYEGNQSNVRGMIKVKMRPNKSRGFMDQTCEVPKHFNMNSSRILRHYYIKQFIQDEADETVFVLYAQ